MKRGGSLALAFLFTAGVFRWLALKLCGKDWAKQVLGTYNDGTGYSANNISEPKQHSETAQQPDAAITALSDMYDKMAAELDNGLNLEAIRAIQPWFHGVTAADEEAAGAQGTALPWPKKYHELAHPLPPSAVRLLVIPLDRPELAAAGAAVTAAVLGMLPPGIKVFSNARSNYHCTLFHTSHPNDPRADASQPDGGVELTKPPADRRGPSAAELKAELDTIRRIVGAASPPALQLHRVLLATSGTLLMTWLDTSGAVANLRDRLRNAFPGASAKQATIIHTSLLRIVSAQQLSSDAIAALQHVCDEWSSRLRGRTFTPQSAWLVQEAEFSTIAGEREIMHYKQ